MLSTFRRFSAAAFATAVALASCGAPAMATQSKIVQVPANASKPGKRGLFNDMVPPTSPRLYGSKSAGITVAQGKRNARKARNVARNRRHHR